MQRFQNKVALITGAGSGMGEAAAHRFSNEGATVVLVGRTQDKLDAVARELPAERVHTRTADVADSEAVNALIDDVIATCGQLDVLVNNAGVATQSAIPETDDDTWRKLMAINVDGVFHTCRAALPHLIETRGNIVNVSSVSGLSGDWGMSVYNATKGAVSNFTRALALDHGGDGVRVNAVCPSLTRTDMASGVFDNEELLAKFAERMPLGAGAEPADIASAIAFLASDDARFITGVNLPVDGGLMASNGQPPQV